MQMRQILTLVLAVLVATVGLLAQAPQFKSQEEVDAFMAIQNATTNEERARVRALISSRSIRRAMRSRWRPTWRCCRTSR